MQPDKDLFSLVNIAVRKRSMFPPINIILESNDLIVSVNCGEFCYCDNANTDFCSLAAVMSLVLLEKFFNNRFRYPGHLHAIVAGTLCARFTFPYSQTCPTPNYSLRHRRQPASWSQT